MGPIDLLLSNSWGSDHPLEVLLALIIPYYPHAIVIGYGVSFTFGYGVDNDDTWCQLLVSLAFFYDCRRLTRRGSGTEGVFGFFMGRVD